MHHSLPGSPRSLYLHFLGGNVTNTQWNLNSGVPVWTTLPFDTDGVPLPFSTAERASISSIWSRVAEDYSPFNIDVTTEPPSAAHASTTVVVVVTSSVDANGASLPYGDSGGIAFVNVFGASPSL